MQISQTRRWCTLQHPRPSDMRWIYSRWTLLLISRSSRSCKCFRRWVNDGRDGEGENQIEFKSWVACVCNLHCYEAKLNLYRFCGRILTESRRNVGKGILKQGWMKNILNSRVLHVSNDILVAVKAFQSAPHVTPSNKFWFQACTEVWGSPGKPEVGAGKLWFMKTSDHMNVKPSENIKITNTECILHT